MSKVKTNYRIKHRLTFMELPQRVVAVEEDDESDQVDEKQPDDCPPGGSSLVFADLALCWALSPPGPDSVLPRPLSHPPGDVFSHVLSHVGTEGGDGQDH